jgi:hypothetical protein
MLKTDHVLGHDGQPSGTEGEYLALSFSPSSAPLRSRWRNNGVSADFIGDYVMTFLPADGNTANCVNQKEIRHAVTYIANEFLENAMKYHERLVDIPIGIRLELTSDRISVSTSNGIGTEQAERYKAFIERIQKHDAGELLLRQLEEVSAGTESTESCLGLLTMMSDYGAKLGWRFEDSSAHAEVMTVTTSAVLSITSLIGANA